MLHNICVCRTGWWVDFPRVQVTAWAEAWGDGASLFARSVGVVVTHGGRALLHNLQRRCCCDIGCLSNQLLLQHNEGLRERRGGQKRVMGSFVCINSYQMWCILLNSQWNRGIMGLHLLTACLHNVVATQQKHTHLLLHCGFSTRVMWEYSTFSLKLCKNYFITSSIVGWRGCQQKICPYCASLGNDLLYQWIQTMLLRHFWLHSEACDMQQRPDSNQGGSGNVLHLRLLVCQEALILW